MNASVKADVIIRPGYHLLSVCVWLFGAPEGKSSFTRR